jgi:hypothetical protein
MKKTLSKIIGSSIIASLLIVPMLSVRAEDDDSSDDATPKWEQIREAEKDRLERVREAEKDRLEALREKRIEVSLLRASTTEKRLENRENNIERIRERIASTTLATTSTSTVKRLEKLDKRFDKQVEQMGKVKERLLNKELKVTEVLGKIASKIQERINILAGKGLDMTAAKAKLALASSKLQDITAEQDALATLIKTEITDANKDTLFVSIKASQDKIRTLAKEMHALLVDTIKEITKVLPTKTATTTI